MAADLTARPDQRRRRETVAWALGEMRADLRADARRTGATVLTWDADLLAGLVGAQRLAAGLTGAQRLAAGLTGAQRLAAALAERNGIDPDQPRALPRSVILA